MARAKKETAVDSAEDQIRLLTRLLEEAKAKVQEEKNPPEPRKRGKQNLRQPLDPLKNMKTPDWNKVVHTCPHCGNAGTVAKLFGVSVKRGRERAQSWCFDCRNSTRYDLQPRKYNLKK
jgi:transcription elongation factor Elf1